jgi:hypothetical protein
MSASDGGGSGFGPFSTQTVARLKAIANNPFRFVATGVALYIVTTLLNFGAFLVETILAGFGFFTAALGIGESAIVGGISGAGNAILSALLGIQQQIAGIVTQAGPAGPVIAVAMTGAILYGAYLAARFILGFVPGLGNITRYLP